MKRPFIVALIVAAVVAGGIGALHASGSVADFEMAIADFISRYDAATRVVGEKWQYLIISILALGTAWVTLTGVRRRRIAAVVGILAVELLGLTWMLSLYGVFFQPVPSIAAIGLAFVLAERTAAFAGRSRTTLANSLYGGRLSPTQVNRFIRGELPLEIEPRTCEATVLVCDIGNKYELVEELDPGVFAHVTQAFIKRASELLIDSEGYIQAADGEGVVAIFGFPNEAENHAEKAVRVALSLSQAFRDLRRDDESTFGHVDVHLGTSSGTMIAAPLQDGSGPALLTSGEPVELARRFCVANRFYGSQVLIGPRTFELSNDVIVARPIDFLSGVNSQERHEIYEPLSLATEARPEDIARRDFFWNGVVFYREKRWAEAYSEFQKARGPEGSEDSPLQLYLRRLEPLALHLTEAPE